MTLPLIFTLIIVLIAAGVGFWAHAANSDESYWLNNRATGLFALVATLVSTQIGAGTVMGIASSTVASGTGYGVLVLLSTMFGFLLVALFAPKIRAYALEKNVVTLPEFIGARYGRLTERMAAVVTVMAYTGFLAGQIVALAAFLKVIGIDVGVSVIWVAGLGAIAYCALSGVKGDIAADCWFFVVMVCAVCILAYAVFAAWTPGLWHQVPLRIQSPVTFGGYSTLIVGVLLGALLPFVQMELWLRVFAAKTAGLARQAMVVSAVWVLPFCLVPLAVGLYASATGFKASTPDTVLLELAQSLLSPLPAAFVVASMTAIILSTTNTLALILGGVISRNILNYRSNLMVQKGAVLAVGLAAIVIAQMADGLVSLILGAAYVLISLCPTVLGALFNWRMSPRFLVFSMGLGAISAVGSYPFLGASAFLPALVVSFTIAGIGWVVEKRKTAKV